MTAYGMKKVTYNDVNRRNGSRLYPSCLFTFIARINKKWIHTITWEHGEECLFVLGGNYGFLKHCSALTSLHSRVKKKQTDKMEDSFDVWMGQRRMDGFVVCCYYNRLLLDIRIIMSTRVAWMLCTRKLIKL